MKTDIAIESNPDETVETNSAETLANNPEISEVILHILSMLNHYDISLKVFKFQYLFVFRKNWIQLAKVFMVLLILKPVGNENIHGRTRAVFKVDGLVKFKRNTRKPEINTGKQRHEYTIVIQLKCSTITYTVISTNNR